MNDKPITSSKDADLRGSHPALVRAAIRARELAQKKGTWLAIAEGGHVRYVTPSEPGVAESRGQYGHDT